MPAPFTSSSHHRASAGFTLIELMITVVIVGVIAAIAIPAFTDSVRKSRRSDAFAALTSVQQAQERWRGNRAAYASNDQLTLLPSGDPPGLGLPATTASGYYGIVISDESAAGYTVTATAVTGTSQASDGNCVRLQIRMDGGNLIYGSAAGTGEFDESANNRCWAR